MNDLISKSALLAEFDPDDTTQFDAIGVRDYIENAPTVEAAPVVQGHINPIECERSGHWGKCSLCRKVMRVEYNYCPNCGAKMDL